MGTVAHVGVKESGAALEDSLCPGVEQVQQSRETEDVQSALEFWRLTLLVDATSSARWSPAVKTGLQARREIVR